MPSKMQEPFIDEPCSCGLGRFVEMIDGNEWCLECNDCEAIKFCYVPLPHQARFHADTSKYRLFAGGYG